MEAHDVEDMGSAGPSKAQQLEVFEYSNPFSASLSEQGHVTSPGSYQTNVNRQRTTTLVVAKQSPYGGADWGDNDCDLPTSPPPPPTPWEYISPEPIAELQGSVQPALLGSSASFTATAKSRDQLSGGADDAVEAISHPSGERNLLNRREGILGSDSPSQNLSPDSAVSVYQQSDNPTQNAAIVASTPSPTPLTPSTRQNSSLGDFFTSNGTQRAYKDRDLQEVSDLLKSTGRDAWSEVPRIYTVLRIIGQLQIIDSFLDQGITDIWFPFTSSSLPKTLSSALHFQFLEVQKAVLTKGLDLEKDEKRKHAHFGRDESLPFKVGAVLGEGRFSQVHKITSVISKRDYARKRFRRGGIRNEAQIKSFKIELKILKRIQHRHCVELVASYTDAKWFGLIMSPVADCDLNVFYDLVENQEQHLKTLRTFYGCLAGALAYLHDSKIRHRDIKPQNILVKGPGVYLADFGISLDWESLSRSTTTEDSAKTYLYCAPEVANFMARNSSSDVWSLGCVFLEMTTILAGLKIQDMQNYFRQKNDNYRFYCNISAIPDWFSFIRSNSFAEIDLPIQWITEMLRPDPTERPTAPSLFLSICSPASHEDNRSLQFCGSCCEIEASSEDEGSDGEMWAEDYESTQSPNDAETETRSSYSTPVAESRSTISTPFAQTKPTISTPVTETRVTLSSPVAETSPNISIPVIIEQKLTSEKEESLESTLTSEGLKPPDSHNVHIGLTDLTLSERCISANNIRKPWYACLEFYINGRGVGFAWFPAEPPGNTAMRWDKSLIGSKFKCEVSESVEIGCIVYLALAATGTFQLGGVPRSIGNVEYLGSVSFKGVDKGGTQYRVLPLTTPPLYLDCGKVTLNFSNFAEPVQLQDPGKTRTEVKYVGNRISRRTSWGIIPLRMRETAFRKEGYLGYDEPGISAGPLLFFRTFFWLGSWAVEADRLQSLTQRQYRDSEHMANTYKDIAWSACTGEGLLYFSNAASGRDSPRGIINLANVSKVMEGEGRTFTLTIRKEIHRFQAATMCKRDEWMGILIKRSEGAKHELAPSIETSRAFVKTYGALWSIAGPNPSSYTPVNLRKRLQRPMVRSV